MRIRHAVVIKFGESKYAAKQSFGDECNINKIIDRFKKTGELPRTFRNPAFGDVSNIPGYHESQNMLIRANKIFQALPDKMKGELLANPEKFFQENIGPAKQGSSVPSTSEATAKTGSASESAASSTPTPTPQQPASKNP